MRRLVLALALLLPVTGAQAATTVRLSFYQATRAQTDATPRRSACGRTRGPWGQIAVSHDLLRRYPCGTRVRVTLHKPKGGIRSFNAVVWDTMPGRRRADVLVGRHEPALRFGITRATLHRR